MDLPLDPFLLPRIPVIASFALLFMQRWWGERTKQLINMTAMQGYPTMHSNQLLPAPPRSMVCSSSRFLWATKSSLSWLIGLCAFISHSNHGAQKVLHPAPRNSNWLPILTWHPFKSGFRSLHTSSTLEGCYDIFKVEPLLPHTVNSELFCNLCFQETALPDV